MKFSFQPEARPLEGYTIKRAVNRGGFGEVYYALTDSGKEVALKLVHDRSEVELRGVSQCLNIKHPNLIMIFDIRKDNEGDCWVVMEFVHGKTLSEILLDHPQGLPMEDVLRWVEGIAEGIGFLHDHGIVHRDLKPANLFMEYGHVKIGDIGLSKFITPSKRSAQTQSVGTVYYMAPEVAHGRYDKEVDVYALGVITYEIITGRLPFDGQSSGEIMMKHLTASPDLSPIPEFLRPVIGKSLEKNPTDRYRDIRDFYKDFRKAVLGQKREASIHSPEIPSISGVNSQQDVSDAQSSPLASREFEKTIKVDHLALNRNSMDELEVIPSSHGEIPSSGFRNRCLQLLYSRTPIAIIAFSLTILAVTAIMMVQNRSMSQGLSASQRMMWSFPLFLMISLFLLGYIFNRLIKGRVERAVNSPETLAGNFTAQDVRHKKLKQPSSLKAIWQNQWLANVFHANFQLGIYALIVVVGMMILMPDLHSSSKNQFNLISSNAISFLTMICISGWGLNLINGWQLRYRSRGRYEDWIYPAWGVVMALVSVMLIEMLGLTNVFGAEIWGSSAIMNSIGPFRISVGPAPTTLGYAIYFGGIFYCIGWLKMTTPFRLKRLTFGWLFQTGLWGYIFALFFYNSNLAVMFPIALSVVMQLSSPVYLQCDNSRREEW